MVRASSQQRRESAMRPPMIEEHAPIGLKEKRHEIS
jgi:hypothetical protein